MEPRWLRPGTLFKGPICNEIKIAINPIPSTVTKAKSWNNMQHAT
jgi:hypothetical protein